MPIPTELEQTENNELRIAWSDGSETLVTISRLRSSCPCATCREKRRAGDEEQAETPFRLPVLSAAEAQPVKITRMRPVGNYAYNVAFSDGHDSGIFTFDFLHDL